MADDFPKGLNLLDAYYDDYVMILVGTYGGNILEIMVIVWICFKIWIITRLLTSIVWNWAKAGGVIFEPIIVI